MSEVRGLVVHIAEGSYEGTIAWQKNPDAQVSSHFVVSKAGDICQMVDTNTVAWTQAAGNGHWISVENEGFSGTPLTGPQLDANARIFAKVCSIYAVPYQVTGSVDGRGLGHHAMGGVPWGNHPDCPGTPIINQKQTIVDLAKGGPVALSSDDIRAIWDFVIKSGGIGDHPAYDLQKQAYDIKANVLPPMDAKLDQLLARPAGELTDAQLDALADKVATRLRGLTFMAQL